MPRSAEEQPPVMARVRRLAWIGGGVATVIAGLGARADGDAFARAYLVAFLFWLSLSLGGLALLMLHHADGGRRGFVSRRPLEAAARTLPLMAALFLPVCLGRADIGAAFALRAGLYLAVWVALAMTLTRWSYAQDQQGFTSTLTGRMRAVSAPGLFAYVLTATFAAFDWIPSLDATWNSTMVGPMFVAGQAIAGLALCVIVRAWTVDHPDLREVAAEHDFRGFANLLIVFILLWGYAAAAQSWAAYPGDDTRRSAHSWDVVFQLVCALQFVLPLCILPWPSAKCVPANVLKLAALLLAMRLLELHWWVTPAWGLGLHWLDLVCPIAVGGIWVATFVGTLQRHPLVALNDVP